MPMPMPMPSISPPPPPHVPPLLFLERVLVLLQNALLHQRLRIRPGLEALLQAIRPHVTLQLLLVALQRGSSARIGEDVALDEGVAVGALGEALLEVVGCTLTLELEGFGL
jgi:hypothetical protein